MNENINILGLYHQKTVMEKDSLAKIMLTRHDERLRKISLRTPKINSACSPSYRYNFREQIYQTILRHFTR